jgi:hypothetical protein
MQAPTHGLPHYASIPAKSPGLLVCAAPAGPRDSFVTVFAMQFTEAQKHRQSFT